MLGHYLLTLYRSLTRQRLYAALNVLGLAVGIAVFLVLMLDVRFEASFERWISDARRIYVIQTWWTLPGHALDTNNATMGGALEEMRGDYPQLVGTRVWDQSATIWRGAQVSPEQVEVVDPKFFKVFNLPLVAGDKATALSAPDALVLTQAEAKRYFKAANPIGRTLTVVFQGAPRVYRVTGVLKDPPRNTDLKFDFLAPLTPQLVTNEKRWRHWGSEQLQTFVRFDQPAEAQALNADLDKFVDRHAGQDIMPLPAHKTITLRAKPLVALHLANPKDAAVVAGLGAVGLLTLVLAALNYVNLATARAGLRAREVALRKVMGATRPALVAQFMAEAIATSLVAAVIGVCLCELALPLVNAAGGLALKVDYLGADGTLVLVLAASLIIGFGAGAYPALVLSRFQPAAVLASTRTPGGGRAALRVREALVVVQFTIAIAFTVATGVIVSQTSYLRHADIGFRRDGLVVVSSFDDSEVTGAQRASLLDLWRTLPHVVGATAADIAPGNDDSTSAENTKRPQTSGEGPTVDWVVTKPDFFTTYGARLLAGRLLEGAHGGDDSKPDPDPASPGGPPVAAASLPARNVVLNTAALTTLGFRNAVDAVGKPLEVGTDDNAFRPLLVVGVIDNIRFRSPHIPVPPTAYMMRTEDFESQVAGVRYAGADPRAVIAAMEDAWRRIVPTVPFRAKTIENNLLVYYRPDDQHGRLFTIGAVLAVAIGCMGLYGLAAFNTARRAREIGIRKTMGASASDILRLLIGQFLRPVLLANLIAWPLAYLAMRSWLGGFDQRVDLGLGYFLAAFILTAAVAALAVIGQAWRAARDEPARALRYE